MAVREPAVSGSFYPADASELRRYCEAQLRPAVRSITAKAVMLPHAGYFYSGQTACHVLSQVCVPRINFLIGPNHHGLGPPFALAEKGEWETPLGMVPVNAALSDRLIKDCRDIKRSATAHCDEHCLEVEVPFLQTCNPQIEIVPLLIGEFDLDKAYEVARIMGQFLASCGAEVLIVVSSDMNHHESDHATRVKDEYALRAIEALDHKALAKAVKSYHITMCGFVPAYMLLAMKDDLGITKATLADYRTSADASGDLDQVVGYAGFIFQ